MNTNGTLIVAISAFLLSISSVFTQYAYNAQTNPLTIVLVRCLAFIPFALLVLIISKQTIMLKINDIPATYLGGLFFSICSACLMISIFYLPISLAILTLYTFPLLTMLLTSVLEKCWPKKQQLLCFICAFLGLMLTLNTSNQVIDWVGIAFAFSAALSISISYLISERKLKHIPALLQTLHFAICGLILASAFALVTQSLTWGSIENNSLWYIAGAAISFAIAFFGMFSGVSLIGAVNTSMTLNLEPIFTIILAMLLLGEPLRGYQYLGAILVILSITVLQLLAKNESRQAG